MNISNINLTVTLGELLSSNELLSFNILLPIISILGLIVNLVVVAVILSDRSMRRNIANIYIVNLAIGDILVLVTANPLWIFQLVTHKPDMTSCQITFGINSFSSGISFLTLTAVSYDRYVSVTRPFSHLQGRKRLYICLGCIWVYVVLITLPFIIGWETEDQPIPPEYSAYCIYTRVFRQEYFLFICVQIIVFLIINTVFYIKLLFVARIHARRIRQDLRSTMSLDNGSAYRFRKQKSLKATKTLGIILGAMLLCWVPWLAVSITDSLDYNTGISFFTVKMLGTLTYLNSIFNPMVYTFMTHAFKSSIKRRIKRHKTLSSFCKHTKQTLSNGHSNGNNEFSLSVIKDFTLRTHTITK